MVPELFKRTVNDDYTYKNSYEIHFFYVSLILILTSSFCFSLIVDLSIFLLVF
jgi:hypothetical protein